MPPRPGDIHWVEIKKEHVVGHEQYKRRPFVVVSRLRINNLGRLVVAVPLSSQHVDASVTPPWIFVPKGEITRDVESSSEIVDCIALTEQVRALDQSRLQEKLGVVSQKALSAILLGIAYVFDIR
jgi:mRNA-degrading endonuclease toxin of MazEF toxin-antitoxin module